MRNVGIRDGKVVRISSEALSGRRLVHAGGLVVAMRVLVPARNAPVFRRSRRRIVDPPDATADPDQIFPSKLDEPCGGGRLARLHTNPEVA
jgi:hypothetical protein